MSHWCLAYIAVDLDARLAIIMDFSGLKKAFQVVSVSLGGVRHWECDMETISCDVKKAQLMAQSPVDFQNLAIVSVTAAKSDIFNTVMWRRAELVSKLKVDNCTAIFFYFPHAVKPKSFIANCYPVKKDI